MKILVTGGTGVIGNGAVQALLEHGHALRLLSRHGSSDAREWPEGVEGVDADVSEPATLFRKADGCDLVLHIAGIATEHPPELTFEKVNVDGTRHVLEEATRAGVKRFVYLSSLGADRGSSAYHRSKLAAETLVRDSSLDWTILRPGNVYGPGDEVISLILKMTRILPVVPVVDFGHQSFQPIWFRDLGEAIARVVDGRDSFSHRVLELGGLEVTTMNDVIDRLGVITGRTTLRVPVPNFLAHLTANAASAFGVDLGVDETKLTMLLEENVVQGENALIGALAMTATPLQDGLRQLAELLPEKLPSEGYGPLRQKRFSVDIAGSVYKRQELFELFRNSFGETMPLAVHVEEQQPRRLDEGVTISMKMPLRGNVQVRVEKVTSSTIVLSTLQGHPVAGFVRFDFRQQGELIHFEIRVIDRSGSFFDLFAMESVGHILQDRAWETVLDRVVKESGGRVAGEILKEEKVLTGEELAAAEDWAEEVVVTRRRKERESEVEAAQRDQTSG